jgi:transposase-like protein
VDKPKEWTNNESYDIIRVWENEKTSVRNAGQKKDSISEKGQHKHGVTPYGTQRILCYGCGKQYTLNPKTRGYSQEKQRKAMQLLVEGMSGRAIGRKMGMSKANVYNWAKTPPSGVDKSEN